MTEMVDHVAMVGFWTLPVVGCPWSAVRMSAVCCPNVRGLLSCPSQFPKEFQRRCHDCLRIIPHHRMAGAGDNGSLAAGDGGLHLRGALSRQDVTLTALDDECRAANGAHVVPQVQEGAGLEAALAGAQCLVVFPGPLAV